MRGIVHPFSKALYEQDGEGNSRVTKDGKTGIFTVDGRGGNGESRVSALGSAAATCEFFDMLTS